MFSQFAVLAFFLLGLVLTVHAESNDIPRVAFARLGEVLEQRVGCNAPAWGPYTCPVNANSVAAAPCCVCDSVGAPGCLTADGVCLCMLEKAASAQLLLFSNAVADEEDPGVSSQATRRASIPQVAEWLRNVWVWWG